MKILLSSAGRRGALLQDFRRAASGLNIPLSVAVTDMTSESVAYQMADIAIEAPRVTAPGYTDWLFALCQEHAIRLVFPLIDPELPILARERERFAEIGTEIVLSGPGAMSISNDKRATETFFQQIGLSTPAVLRLEDVRAGLHPFPIFIKPNNGSSSIGSRRLDTLEDLEYFWPRTNDPILMEYAPGDEYTVDVYCGLDGDVRCAVPRRRLRVRHGEVEKGRTELQPELIEQAMHAARHLDSPRGVINFQCIVGGDGISRWIELNARFGGGAPLSHYAGADFPRWLLEEAEGRTPNVIAPGFTPGVTMLRFDDAVFLPSESANAPMTEELT